ncbi:MAG: hypothetical protein HY331_10620 [Chloroflexi bacterium]|nr:hypothetical protein [Chloroflexota bacterium]
MRSTPGWRYLDTFFRFGRWFGAFLILLPALVGVATFLNARSYEATTRVWVDAQTADLASADRPQTVADERRAQLQQLLMTTRFRDDVAAHVEQTGEYRFESPAQRAAFVRQLPRRTAVEVAGPSLLELRYRSSDPQLAPAALTAILDTFEQQLFTIQESTVQRAVGRYQARLEHVQAELAVTRRQLIALDEDTSPSSTAEQRPDRALLQRKATALSAREALLIAKQPAATDAAASTLLAVPTLAPIDEPRVPDAPTADWLRIGVATALAFMLAVAVIAAATAILARLDRTVRYDQDVRRYADVAVVGRIPSFARWETDGSRPRRTTIS